MSAGVALLVFILAFVIFSMLLKVPVPFGLAIASLFVFLGTNMNPITVAQYSFASLCAPGNPFLYLCRRIDGIQRYLKTCSKLDSINHRADSRIFRNYLYSYLHGIWCFDRFGHGHHQCYW